MRNLKRLITTISLATALTFTSGIAKADLFLMKDGSKIYNYSKIEEDSYQITAKNKQGEKIILKKSELRDYIFIREGRDLEKEIDETTADKLVYLKNVEHWGEEKLGLPVSDNFIVYDTKFETSHVIYYSKKLRLPKNYFDMPGKGYDTEKEALERKKELELQGYDVFYRSMEASSNSPMISRSLLESKLSRKIEVILHENMHDFIHEAMNNEFLPLSIDEALACVVGDYGSLEYLSEKYGKQSDEYKTAEKTVNKIHKHAKVIIKYYNKLDDLFKTNLNDEEKLKQKEQILNELQQKRTEVLGHEADYLNNPGLAAHMTYSRYVPLIKKVYEKTGSVKELIQVSKKMADVMKKLPWNGEKDIEDKIIKYFNDYLQP